MLKRQFNFQNSYHSGSLCLFCQPREDEEWQKRAKDNHYAVEATKEQLLINADLSWTQAGDVLVRNSVKH